MPYDTLLGLMVSIREAGKQRRVTAAEAFLLQLTRKGLAGDSAAARASLAAIENARSGRAKLGEDLPTIFIRFRSFGMCGTVEDLGMAVRLHPHDKDRVRFKLKPWIVEEALARLGARRLTEDEQRTVVTSTQTPHRVTWPEWWSVREA